ncbi:SDR family NAD(P)-dependent oxidoreductase [Ereboglobus luteus]|uniref:Short-chain dehydrogenase n=1 Tax=Ereboglobus luteus TaxID=1796921 RepID=A0A2U8E4I2_9BACT|nr:SDR family NAD(P)-dependent oxidoreductase [Ereboglobus luteus]AWI09848.1 short-chain dehydrogenase [Ereboglobus luteus]
MIKQLFNLHGKTALVTGGGQGIGRAIALALAENGADVVITYLGNDALASQTAADAAALGAKTWLWRFDIMTDNLRESWREFAAANNINVDILVTNASLQIRRDWEAIDADEFTRQINTNIRSTLQLIQETTPRMKQTGWGRILNIGSVQQVRPHRQMLVYAATKSALVNMVKNLAAQLAPSGITVNNLAPGTIGTARNETALSDPDYKKLVESKIPLGKIGRPEDCAALAALLCSDAGRYITGADIPVDGGMGLCF